jgi:TonB-dependent receptor
LTALPLVFACAAQAQTVDPAQSPTATGAPSQDTAAEPADTSRDIIVTGFRQSLRNSQAIKQNATEIVDSIVAEDIGKLPDNNLSEALQRVPGVQITRNHGEGSGVAIRGLSQVKTLVNGREVFSDTGRDLSLENVPAEILAGLDVYKNPSATLVEGGLGGVINLKTRKPFDFPGFQASVSGRVNHYDLADKAKWQVSGLISDRFDTGMGEIGVLLGLAHIKTIGRLDSNASEPFQDRYNIVDFNNNGVFVGRNGRADGRLVAGGPILDPGDLVIAPTGAGNSSEPTERNRTAVNGMVQWRPTADTELFLEGTYNKYTYKGEAGLAYVNRGDRFAAPDAPFTFWEGTNVVKSGTYRDVQFTAGNNFFDRDAYTWQISGGGSGSITEQLKLVTDVSYTKSARTDRGGGLRAGTPPSPTTGVFLFFDNGTRPVTADAYGIDFNNPAVYSYLDSFENIERAEGSSLASRADLTYSFVDSPLTSVMLGARVAKRDILRQQGGDSHFTGPQPVSTFPGLLIRSQFADDFFRGTDIPQPITKLLSADVNRLRDTEELCRAFNDPTCFPTFQSRNQYSMSETTTAIYGQANFNLASLGLPVDGNAGLRYVKTELGVVGVQISTTNVETPLDQQTSYENWLPSLNVRVKFTDELFLRLAAAKQLTRPGFNQLSPTLALGFNSSTGLISGTGGNPDLRPLISKSYDASLEYYYSANGYIYASGFLKKVDGFIQNVVTDEPISLPEFPNATFARISRLQNGDNGTIKGFEVGIQTFFDFLPSPLDGFGVQANYTFVDSKAPGPIAGTDVPLQGLSKNSYNIVGFFEKWGFRARVAYNYRDDYVETTSGPGSGALPVFSAPFGVLDASIGYNINEHIDISIDGTNLLKTASQSYFGEEIRPRFRSVYDRRLGIVLRVKS